MALKVEKKWPVLCSKTRLGKTKYWVICTKSNSKQAFIETEYWQDDGAHQTAQKEILGKNIGRANETTPIKQAQLEAEAQYQKQKDKGYTTQKKARSSPYLLPMLAHSYVKRSHDLAWPCYAQPKLDGFRCLYSEELGFWSRNGKPFGEVVDLNHLKVPGTFNLILDGELILPKGYSFQQTCEAIKKQRPETKLLQYHVFDLIDLNDLDMAFEDRLNHLKTLKAAKLPKQVEVVETSHVISKEEAMQLFSSFIAEGYEGLILRNSVGRYEPGHRSPNLQKFKEFQDAEFTVVDVVEGVGKEKGAATFVCETAAGRAFLARPVGSYEERRKIFDEKNTYVGKPLKVKFQGLSKDLIPRFPVGLAIRPNFDI